VAWRDNRAQNRAEARQNGTLGVNVMESFLARICRFLESEDGPTAVEYAVMLTLIVVVCLTAISSIGAHAQSAFQKVASSIHG
jgi:pilus assembly protein Flp/PilA